MFVKSMRCVRSLLRGRPWAAAAKALPKARPSREAQSCYRYRRCTRKQMFAQMVITCSNSLDASFEACSWKHWPQPTQLFILSICIHFILWALVETTSSTPSSNLFCPPSDGPLPSTVVDRMLQLLDRHDWEWASQQLLAGTSVIMNLNRYEDVCIWYTCAAAHGDWLQVSSSSTSHRNFPTNYYQCSR